MGSQLSKPCVLPAVAIAALVWLWIRRVRKMSLLRRCGIPGPKPNLISGNLNEFEATKNVLYDDWLTEEYGPVSGYYLGAKPVILVSDIDLIKEILGSNASVFCERPRRVPGGINPDWKRTWMLGNLASSAWKKIRYVVQKFFREKNLREVIPAVQERMDTCLALIESGLNSEMGEGELDLYELFQRLTLEIISHIGFGIRSDIQCQRDDDPFLRAVQGEFDKKTNSSLIRFYLCFPEIAWLLHPLRRFQQFIMEKSNRCPSLPLWKQGFMALASRRNIQEDVQVTEKMDMLDHLTKATPALTDIQIVANSVLFLEAGYETTSTILGVLVNLIARHEDVQLKIREELAQVQYGIDEENSRLMCCGDKPLVYLTAVIYEALRMYPPQTTFLGRSAIRDFVYADACMGVQYIIPKGCHVQIGLVQLQNSREIWEKPQEFKPSRFLEGGEGLKNMKTFKWLAFGGGQRYCVGKAFAMNNLRLVLSNILSRYWLEPCERTESNITMEYKTATMSPKYGVIVKVVKRPIEFD